MNPHATSQEDSGQNAGTDDLEMELRNRKPVSASGAVVEVRPEPENNLLVLCLWRFQGNQVPGLSNLKNPRFWFRNVTFNMFAS